MEPVQPHFSNDELRDMGGILGACRGFREGVNASDANLLVTTQEVLMVVMVLRLERLEQLLLEMRGR